MFESVTYEDILDRMLDRVPEDMDKREGSIIYDALAPCAVELQLMYIELDVILNEAFADTASREYLIRRAAERGIEPKQATNAILKGVFTPTDLELEIGQEFSCDELNYVVTEKIADGEYKLTCQTGGSEGNTTFGELIPIDYLDGLETAELTELIEPARDEEDTETFRRRYLSSFNSQAYGGNVTDYIEKTNAIDGVGATKVTPIWNGGGTVKLTIMNTDFEQASDALVEQVQEAIDPTQDGSGIGIAPIGHIVTVDTVENVAVNVACTIVYDDGYSFNALQSQIESAISNYLSELRKTWSDEESLTVRAAQITARLLMITGIDDVTNIQLNGVSGNIQLESKQIPVLGGVSG